MSDNFFPNDDEFRDNPVEMENGQWKEVETVAPAPKSKPTSQAQRSPVVTDVAVAEEVYEDVELLDEDDDFTEVLSDASLRLEQGNLYKMIMNHSLFEGMEADPRAVKNVEREIKRFARERMEVMLGMRQEQTKETIVSSPFNSLEVDILKRLASKASGGATESPEANKVAQTLKETPKRQTLNPISAGKPSNKMSPVLAKKLATKPQAPLERPKATSALTNSEYKPLEKDPSTMSTDELLARNKEAAERQAKTRSVKSSSAIPQPSYEQEEMLYTQRTASALPAVAAIVSAINQSKSK